jgi:quercetin dioxygenase-like cupin family protein
MRKLMIPAVALVVGLAAAAAWSQTPGSRFQATPYFTTPLEGDGSRIVKLQTVTIPPGASNEFHRHNGD